ncbi:MAG TPA: hypothetical protein VGI54_11865 [Solirubrobacteraceae bacterium]
MRLLTVTVLTLCLPLLAACGGGADKPTHTDGAPPAAVPAGFKGYTGAGFSIAYPAGWTPAGEQADPHRLVELRPPGEEATRPLIGVALERTGQRTTLEAYAATFSVTQTMDIPGWRAVSEQAVDVPGAIEGRLLHAAYKLPGGATQVRELVLFARLPGGRVYVVRAGGEASAFAHDEHQLRTAVDSFRPAKGGTSA